jgi:hypothetical protein
MHKRNIVVLLDNAPTHMLAVTEIDEEHGFKIINLLNLKLVFLPGNNTNVVQPLDQGIIACTKTRSYLKLLQWVIAEAEKPENACKSLKELRPNFYQMMRWLNTAWKERVSPSDHLKLLSQSRHLAGGLDCSAHRHTCSSSTPHTQW